jgi:hypothetical protein
MMTDWIKWNGGECPIKSDKTWVLLNLGGGSIVSAHVPKSCAWDWQHGGTCDDIIAYRITEDHEPMDYDASPIYTHKMTREQITAQIEALQKQLDTMPVISRVHWGAAGTYYFTHEEVVEVINGVPHIHGVAMKLWVNHNPPPVL